MMSALSVTDIFGWHKMKAFRSQRNHRRGTRPRRFRFQWDHSSRRFNHEGDGKRIEKDANAM